MIRSFAAILALSFGISACGSEAVPYSSDAETAQHTAQTTEQQPQSTAAETAAPEESAAETSETLAAGESAPEVSNTRLAAAPAGQPPAMASRWQAGKHYMVIDPAQPTTAGPGKVEVLEFFWYACSHCYALEPFLESWTKKKPEYVEFVRVPVLWGGFHRMHARLFYTLEALGRSDLHDEVFNTIHRQNNLLVANSEEQSRRMQVDFAKANGISEDEFLKAYNSFGVNSNLQRAEQLMRRYRVEGVPYIVINGKFATDVGRAGGQENLISLINDLAATERRR